SLSAQSSLHLHDLHSFPTRRSSDLEVESLRTFDQETQRSLNPISLCIVGPAREALPVRGPDAARELEQLNSNRMLYRDAEERWRSEEHTSELQSQSNLVCRLLLEKK